MVEYVNKESIIFIVFWVYKNLGLRLSHDDAVKSHSLTLDYRGILEPHGYGRLGRLEVRGQLGVGRLSRESTLHRHRTRAADSPGVVGGLHAVRARVFWERLENG